jgi:hypothetical protein
MERPIGTPFATSSARDHDRPIPGQEISLRNALVPIALAADADKSDARARSSADFIAQLIATKIQAPQTRARRRAEPKEATAAYRALGQWPTGTGRKLSRLF